MSTASQPEITSLLVEWSNGDKEALDKLMPMVYEELRRMAHYYMRGERDGHTLQTTAIVHEAYLRLVNYQNLQVKERAHFFAVAAIAIRRILVEHARSHNRIKRGGDIHKILLDEVPTLSTEHCWQLVALEDALVALEACYPRKCRVVELRYFGGLSNEEIAEVLKISVSTVIREWTLAKAWLHREIGKKAID
ncbi:MAG: sigma-70 family RNA polymerase sigma factor [Acidobacteriota bacterium]